MSDAFASNVLKGRFSLEVLYVFLSHSLMQRITLRLFIFQNSILFGLGGLYSSAHWLEREMFDLFGVYFYNSELRRILTDYGFNLPIMLKSLPLSGFSQLRFSISQGSVSVDTFNFWQDIRFISVMSFND